MHYLGCLKACFTSVGRGPTLHDVADLCGVGPLFSRYVYPHRRFFDTGLANVIIVSFGQILVICGPGPLSQIRDQVVLDRIIMNIINVSLKVGFISDLMFPETSLPEGCFTCAFSRGISCSVSTALG